MKITLYLKNTPVTFSGQDNEVLALLATWMSQNDGLVHKPAKCDGLTLYIGEDGDPATEAITWHYQEFFGSETEYTIESGYRNVPPYDVEEFFTDWDGARRRFLELALEYGPRRE